MLGSYVPFTYLFAVTLYYKTGAEVDNYSPTLYSWRFTRFLHLSGVVVNTTSPLLNYTFEAADTYHYYLWVSNAVSTVHATGNIRGISYSIAITLYHAGMLYIITKFLTKHKAKLNI